jgi:hypothetical protein
VASANHTHGLYYAFYIIRSVDEKRARTELKEGALSGFGEGDDQWEGLYVEDPGASIRFEKYSKFRTNDALMTDLSLVIVQCPVSFVPRNYWISPADLPCPTYGNDLQTDLRGEPYDYGMKKFKWD